MLQAVQLQSGGSPPLRQTQKSWYGTDFESEAVIRIRRNAAIGLYVSFLSVITLVLFILYTSGHLVGFGSPVPSTPEHAVAVTLPEGSSNDVGLSLPLDKRLDPGSVIVFGLTVALGGLNALGTACDGGGTASCIISIFTTLLGAVIAGTAKTAASKAIFGRRARACYGFNSGWHHAGGTLDDTCSWMDFVNTKSDEWIELLGHDYKHRLELYSHGNGTVGHRASFGLILSPNPHRELDIEATPQPGVACNGGESNCGCTYYNEYYYEADATDNGGDAGADLDTSTADDSDMATSLYNQMAAGDDDTTQFNINDPSGTAVTGTLKPYTTQICK